VSRVGRIGQRLVPSLADTVFIATLLLVLMTGQELSNRDGDLGRHLTVGRVILETGRVPTTDVFSHALRGKAFVPHEWLAEVAFALAHAVLAFKGVALLAALGIAAPFGGVAAAAARRGVSPLVILAVTALGILASMAHWATRPHVFSFVFVWLFATALEDLRRGHRRHVAWLVPLTAVWANTHGAFIVGFVLVATYLVSAGVEALLARTAAERSPALGQARHLALVLALSVAASAANPRGLVLLANSFAYLGQGSLLDLTSEYNSPDFHHPVFWPFLLWLLLALVVGVRREVAPTLLLVSWAAFSLYSFRNLALFVIVCLPLIAEAAGDWVAAAAWRVPSFAMGAASSLGSLDERIREAGAGLRGGLAPALVVVAVGLSFAGGLTLALDGSDYGFREGDFPVAAVARYGTRPPGERVFNRMDWGGYLLFAAWPRLPVFIDGQTDFYGPAHAASYVVILDAAEGWQVALDRYRVDWALVRPEDPLARWLAVDPAWREIYRDRTAAAFVRREAGADGPAS
jgi:hypothetical protein